MTDKEWGTTADVEQLLAALPIPSSRRKLRLFAVACCRRVWHLMTEDATRHAVEMSEKYADGGVRKRQMEAARQEANQFVNNSGSTPAEFMAASVARGDFLPKWIAYLGRAAESGVSDDEKRVAQSGLLRDIFDNPFRPVEFSPSWRTDTAVALARQMYDSRDFDAMPILADALQDAGCDNDDILNHCRDAKQVHVRGCWVVDLVLNKS